MNWDYRKSFGRKSFRNWITEKGSGNQNKQPLAATDLTYK